MSQQVYALLVGINEYAANVGALTGCVNDVGHVNDYLNDTFADSVHIVQLLNADANRENVIQQFREHLGRATKDDVAFLHYSGHGARCKSAEAFRQFVPSGWDEGLVLHNSREPGGFDLADKELAALLAELAKNDPHIAVLLDCCHSGSATRSVEDITQLRSRQTHEVVEERPLESYLDGYYSELNKSGASLDIPPSRHILLAACERVQKAWEGKDHRGVFSSTLLDVLSQTGPNIPYADLFVRCRAAVRQRADNQNPQFETYRRFNAYNGFLGSESSHTGRRYSAYFDDNCWRVDCGALHGLPGDPEDAVELALYSEDDQSQLLGHAETIQVGPQKSDLQLLDCDIDSSTRCQAEITSLPVPPLAVSLAGDTTGVKAFQEFHEASEDRSYGFSLMIDEWQNNRYTVSAEDDCFLLKSSESGRLIQGAKGYTRESANYMFSILKRVAAWERALKLQNHWTQMKMDDVSFRFCEVLGDGEEGDEQVEVPGNDFTIDINKVDGEWKVICGTLKANNCTQQPLHMMLVHFSEDFGFEPLYNDRIDVTESDFTVSLDGNAIFNLSLDDDEGDTVVHAFKLIVSTEKADDFLLGQEPIDIGEIVTQQSTRGLSYKKSRKKVAHENEWFTKDVRVKLVRQLGQVSAADTKLADNAITIRGHDSLTAGVSLTAVSTPTSSVASGPGIHRALERQGLELLSFAGTAGESNKSILELTNIHHSEDLQQYPLQIEVAVDLAEDEVILPLAFDGEQFVVVGETSRDDSGRISIKVNHIPATPDDRRSDGRTVKLYFFKSNQAGADVDKLEGVKYENASS